MTTIAQREQDLEFSKLWTHYQIKITKQEIEALCRVELTKPYSCRLDNYLADIPGVSFVGYDDTTPMICFDLSVEHDHAGTRGKIRRTIAVHVMDALTETNQWYPEDPEER